MKERKEKIVETEIREEMSRAYIDYAMSVIASRALPSVEDGLKPVQRRILYAMYIMGLTSDKQTRKTARIVGETMGKFHPHGDIAIYDALVRMAQDFSLRYPLVHGQGNFGNIDGDPPAAQRYTEAKLTKIAEEMLQDIEKKTVQFVQNFDNSLEEPVVLPAKLPNLLLNGATGIAVGMTTNIPPHNLNEVADAIINYIENPNISIEKISEIIKGPDFPTGGYVVVNKNWQELCKNGKASLVVRGKVEIEKATRPRIIISEIPYQINKSDLVSEIAALAKSNKLPDVSCLRDESAKGKIRIVIELKKDAEPSFTINRLYKFTRLETKFDAIMLALVGGVPKIVGIKDIIAEYVNHRKNIVTRKCKFELEKAENRLHILQGLLLAISKLDMVIETIKKSNAVGEALELLQKNLAISAKQAQAILDMKLQQLTSLEHEKLKKELVEIEDKIKELKKILASNAEILNIIKKELQELKRKYGDARRTKILQKIAEIREEDIVARKDVVLLVTSRGYTKRMPLKIWHEQRRGGKGVVGAELATEDFVRQIISCNTHDNILFFTNRGKVYWLKAYQIPEAERYGKGKALVNLLNLKDEMITTIMPTTRFQDFLIMATKKGIVKKILFAAFSRPKTGIKALKLPYDDLLVDVKPAKEEDIMLITKKGFAIKFSSKEIRQMSRAAYGICGIKLRNNDEVIGMEIIKDKKSLLSITSKGYGKRSSVEAYRKTARACKGIINMKITSKTGNVVSTAMVSDKDSIIVATKKGMTIRIAVKDIREMGRSTQGVRIIKLQEGDEVIDMIKVEEPAAQAAS